MSDEVISMAETFGVLASKHGWSMRIRKMALVREAAMDKN